jgi:endonuclease-3
MTKKEKASYVIEELEKLYPETPIPLNHLDAYTLLIAVLLSAQCTDERVNQITPTLFSRAATPSDMILLSVEEIREIIKPCGLSPRKSQAIFDLSHIILDKHQGEVPQSFEDLEAMPGVGHKTASVVMSQAFGVPAFPVDTHIHRLMTRWGLTSGKNVELTEKDKKEIAENTKKGFDQVVKLDQVVKIFNQVVCFIIIRCLHNWNKAVNISIKLHSFCFVSSFTDF